MWYTDIHEGQKHLYIQNKRIIITTTTINQKNQARYVFVIPKLRRQARGLDRPKANMVHTVRACLKHQS